MIDIGIDLGSTYALASYVSQQGTPALVPDSNDASEFRTPTLVHVTKQHVQIGRPVSDRLIDEPGSHVARGFKRHLGDSDWCFKNEHGDTWHATSLSSLVLRKLVRDVELFIGEKPDRAVIGVPANFNDAQRRATKAAASLAGLSQVRLVEEPVAAAIFYGLTEKSAEQTLLIYDFGGGTFDASLVQIAEGKVHVLGTDGDTTIGGLAIDQGIIDFLLSEFRRQHGVPPHIDTALEEDLRRHAEELKIQFSQIGKQNIRKMLVVDGKVLELHFSRQQVDNIIQPMVEETMKVTERCLKSTGLSWRDVDRVLLAGGSSLLPQVSARLAQISGKSQGDIMSRQPHQAVAFGAALLASKADTNASSSENLPVAPYNLGIHVRDPRTGEPAVDVVIKRNSKLPARASKTFYTNREDQSRIVLNVVQSKGDDHIAHSLGLITFGPLRRPQKNLPVEVTLSYDREGLVRISARDGLTGESIEQILGDREDAGIVLSSSESELLARLQLL